MLKAQTRLYDRFVKLVSTRKAEALMLLFVRFVLAGIFWRSGRTKVDEGSWLSISEDTFFQFGEPPFNKVPLLSSELAAYFATYAEHGLPILVALGLFIRLSALALLGMTLIIQLFVFPEAWWPVHSLWAALALVLVIRGAGSLSFDAYLASRRA